MYVTIVQHMLVVPTRNTAGTVRCGTHLTRFRCVVCVFVTDNSSSMTYKASYCWSDWGLMPIYTQLEYGRSKPTWNNGMWYLQIESYSEDHFELSNQGLHLQGNPTEIKQPPSELPPKTIRTNNINHNPNHNQQQQTTTTIETTTCFITERVTLLYMLCSNSSKELVNLHHSALPPQDVYDVYDGKVMGVGPAPFPRNQFEWSQP